VHRLPKYCGLPGLQVTKQIVGQVRQAIMARGKIEDVGLTITKVLINNFDISALTHILEAKANPNQAILKGKGKTAVFLAAELGRIILRP